MDQIEIGIIIILLLFIFICVPILSFLICHNSDKSERTPILHNEIP